MSINESPAATYHEPPSMREPAATDFLYPSTDVTPEQIMLDTQTTHNTFRYIPNHCLIATPLRFVTRSIDPYFQCDVEMKMFHDPSTIYPKYLIDPRDVMTPPDVIVPEQLECVMQDCYKIPHVNPIVETINGPITGFRTPITHLVSLIDAHNIWLSAADDMWRDVKELRESPNYVYVSNYFLDLRLALFDEM